MHTKLPLVAMIAESCVPCYSESDAVRRVDIQEPLLVAKARCCGRGHNSQPSFFFISCLFSSCTNERALWHSLVYIKWYLLCAVGSIVCK